MSDPDRNAFSAAGGERHGSLWPRSLGQLLTLPKGSNWPVRIFSVSGGANEHSVKEISDEH
jgi:hypothetical protein